MSPATPPTFDALIVGAGWAGLTCALRLSHAGKRVLCLEARQRLGGRAFTHTWNDDTPMTNHERTARPDEAAYSVDFGCSYIHGYNEGNPVKEIAKKLGVQTYIPKPTPARIVGPKGMIAASLSDRLQANLQAAQQAAKTQGKRLREDSQSDIHSTAAQAVGQTPLSSVLLDSVSSPLYAQLNGDEERALATSLARSLHIPLGTELENVALEYFGHESNFAGTDAMPDGGFSHLIAQLAQQVEKAGGQIHRGEEARQIVQQESVDDARGSSGVRVIARTEQGGEERTYLARTAIVTVPLAVLKARTDLFEPALEPQRRDAIMRTSVGNLNKVLLTYEKPWWSAEIGTFFVLPTSSPTSTPPDLAGLFASTTLIVSSLCSPNGLPQHMTSPSLLVMIGGMQGKQIESFDRLHVAEELHAYLAQRMSEHQSAAEVPLRHTFYSRWARQPFTGGATTTPVTLGNTRSDFDTLARPTWDDRLFFAGEHCEPDHRGSVAGAVVSAQSVGDAVLRQLNGAARY